MNFTESIRLAFGNLKSNRLRSFLTMLGIIIGISSVITITTIGNSLQKTIAATMRDLGGTNLIYASVDWIYPEFETDAEWEAWVPPEMTEDEKITYDRLMEFKKDFADTVSNVIITEDIGSVGSCTTDEGTAKVRLSGVTPGYLDYMKVDLVAGRDITEEDNRQMKATAVVSDLFVKYACGGKNPIGKQMAIQSEDGAVQKFYVVGVYHYDPVRMGNAGDNTPERDIPTQMMVPYTYAAMVNKAEGMDNDGIQYFQITAKEGTDPTQLSQDITAYFHEKYFAANNNFELYCYDMASELGTIDQVLNILTIAISVIAAISLIVGGVGVMNIMLVSVVERTREIGIRKAMGAKNKSIRRQFLTEAVVICLMGGVIGIAIGIVNGFVLAKVAAVILTQYEQEMGALITLSVSPSLMAIVISVVFSMLIGMIFGSYPAKRAAQMSPIDALRYE
ncbi:MAG: ABC transporter permease [Lachnospiraceae bacterium]|nr:ABC transporter permease [Lachnospiraceae bacterium]